MIRVTFKGSREPVYYDYMIYPLMYRNYSDMIEFRCYIQDGCSSSTTSDAIKKIEKQVKDLTVKELMHLNIEVIRDRVIVDNKKVCSLEHWVDVTYILSEPNEKFEELNKCVRLWKEIN